MPDLFGKNWSRHEVLRRCGDPAQCFGLRLVTCADGVERGLRVLEFNAGAGLRFDVLVDRCMDIGALAVGSVPIGWQSSTGFRHPWLHEVDAEKGLGWLRSFSGFLVTCGLDHVMQPCEEQAIHYNRPQATLVHGLHGRVSYLPAHLVGYGAQWEGDRCTLWAEGEIRQSAVFAENLHLTRRIETDVGSGSFRVRDTVVNEGFYRTPHMLLYHVNLGWPLLDTGAELCAPVKSTRRVSTVAQPASNDWRVQLGPQRDFAERCFEHELAAEADGTVPVAVLNRALRYGNDIGVALLMEYDQAGLPVLAQWQNFQEGQYALGIEPCTVHAGTRAEQVERGDVRWLQPGERSEYELSFSVCTGRGALDIVQGRIDTVPTV